MPRYLVTLRHAETGETRTRKVWADDQKEAFYVGAVTFDGNYDANGCALDVWQVDHACPADDVPVPGRDR